MIYFDNAATGGRKPYAVQRAVRAATEGCCANPGRSGHALALAMAEDVLRARQLLARFFNAPDPERVIFTQNCTHALNLAIFGLCPENGETSPKIHVVSTVAEHNSVLRTLFALERRGKISLTLVGLSGGRIRPQDIAAAVREDTAAAVFTLASNVTGMTVDPAAVRALLPERVLTVCDGAQACGHIPVDMQGAGIDALADAARRLGKPARVHVKVDSGFGRNGFTPAGFDAALAKLVPLAKEGVLHIVGQWSHLAVADSPDVPEFVSSTDRQIETFKDFTRRMEQAGIPPEIRHLANTAATLDRPEIHFELTRPGIGLYGYEPDPAMGTPRDWHLTPAMRLQAQLGTVKDVEAGHGISYGRTYLTPDNTSTAIVPLGYADGIHRSASGFDMEGAKHVEKPGGPVRIMTTEGPKLYRVCGRVCMDQFIVDLHGSAAELGVHEGDTVELFGPGRGEDYVEPTADDWARAADTISYEIFTCLRNRIPRLYEHATDVLSAEDLAKLDPASIL